MDRGLPAGGVILAAPTLFAAGFVLTVFADSGSATESLPRPVVIAALAAVLVQALCTVALRDPVRGALTSLVIVAFVVDPMLAVILLLVIPVVVAYTRWRGFSAAPLVSWLAVVVVILFAISSLRMVTSSGFNVSDLFRGRQVVVAGEAGPDIFMVMLDGYPRSDTLAEWGYDNEWFTTGLEDRGFEVAHTSRTDYSETQIVLPTMFHMRHVEEIEAIRELASDRVTQRRQIRSALTDPPALERLRDAGYVTVTSGHPDDYITIDADRFIDGGWLNDFEHQVLYRTQLAGITTPLVLDVRRGLIHEALDSAKTVASDRASTFLFAHVLSPHTPFLFDREGNQPDLSCVRCAFRIHVEQSRMTASEFRAKYADQVHYLNRLVLDTVDGILRESPDAVIILFSDHGSRANIVRDAEWLRTFFAARTPGQTGVFPDDVRPIEIFPRLFRALFGDEVTIPASHPSS